MRFLISIIICCCFIQCSAGYKGEDSTFLNDSSYHILDFLFEKNKIIDNPWYSDLDENEVTFFDELDHTQGVSSLAMTSRGMQAQFEYNIYHYFTLSALSNVIEITIDSKSKNMVSAWLKVVCFDSRENKILTDSVSIISPGLWKKSSLLLKTNNIQYLYIEIVVKSDSISNSLKKQNIDNLEIISYDTECNSKKNTVIEYPIFDEKHPIKLEGNTDVSFNSISDLKNKKILAIGESAHGSDECQKLTYELIKYQIEKNKCRLVMFEMPFNIGLTINAYIHGKDTPDIEKELMVYNCNFERFMKFIDWVKNYNKPKKEKVIFLGIDTNRESIGRKYFKEYFDNMNIAKDSQQYISDLIYHNEFAAVLESIRNNKFLYEYDEKILKLLMYGLELHDNEGQVYSVEGKDRDMDMFKTSFWGINELLSDSSTAIVYGHLIHINKMNSYIGRLDYRSYGCLMEERFKNQYYTIALLLGSGVITSTELFANRGYNYKLVEPIENSIERLCDSEGSFYSKVSSNTPSLTCRIIGLNYSTIQYYPNSAKDRFDAFFYIKNSSGFRYPDNWPKSREEYLKIIQQ